MFRCDQCHTEYGGIRGLAVASCPRCESGQGTGERRDWSTRPFADGEQSRSEAQPLRLLRRSH